MRTTLPPHQNSFEILHNCIVEFRELEVLKTDLAHPRKATPKQVKAATGFIRATAFTPPIVVDRNDVIIVGEEWLEAARILGVSKVQVMVADTLTNDQIRIFRIAYTKIQTQGEWDPERLRTEFLLILDEGLTADIGLECTGFETAEIDMILCSQLDGSDLEESVQIDPEAPVVSQVGDIWCADNHRIACCNSLDIDLVRALTENNSIDLVCSDPPYNVKIDGFVSGKGQVKHREFAMASGEMSPADYNDFLYNSLLNTTKNLKNGGFVYLCIDWRHMEELQAAAKRCGLVLVNVCVWDKGTGAMGSLYRSQHELVFVFKKGKHPHQNNIQLGKFGRNRTNVWSYPSANMSKEGREALKDHPTPKPVNMIADIIKDVTKIGEKVFDPFLGGGTALIAAEKTSRICYGIELDPRYVDVTIRRWQELTGREAIHYQTGLTFADHEAGKHLSKKSVKENRHVRER